MFQHLLSLISDGWLPPALDIVTKSSVLLVLTSVVCWLLRERSASLRHRLWTLALAGCIAVPVIAIVGPQLRIPLLRANPVEQKDITSLTSKGSSTECCEVESGTAVGMPTPLPEDSNAASSSELNSVFSCTIEDALDSENATSGTADSFMVITYVGWQYWLPAIWLAGFLFVLIRLGTAAFLQHRRMVEMKPIDDIDWATSVAAIAKQLGVTRSYSTVQSPTAAVPITYGVFRAVIVVPPDWSKWSDEHRNCVLSHELAHVQRFDVAIQLFARAIAAVYWFNPLIWLAVYRLRVEREFACDDAVLLSGRRPSDYADALLTTLRHYRRRRFDLGVALADSARLDSRVEAILDQNRRRHPPGRKAKFFLAILIVCCVFLIGAVTLTRGVARENATTDEEHSDADPVAGLSKSIIIRGVVTGPDERPIANAELYVNVKEYQDSIKLGTSDPDGAFRFEVPRETLTRMVSPGVFLGQCKASLVAVAEGAGAAWEFLPSEDGGRYGDMKREYEVRLQMVEDLPIKGRIVDEAGEPVGGAVVSVDYIHELRGKTWYKMSPAIEALDVNSIPQQEIDVNGWSSDQYPRAFGFLRATTDESGYYTLTGLGSNRAVRLVVSGPGIQSPPTFSVLVRKDGSEFAQKVREKYPSQGDAHGVRLFGIDSTVAVHRARTVAGTVRDAVTGEPVENANVCVLGGTRVYTLPKCQVRTDRMGKFRLVCKQEETQFTEFTVVVDGDKHLYLPASRTFKSVTDTGETTADFEIPRGVLIRGKVVEVNTNRPIAAEHRNFCDDIQPGPLYSGYAKYYPLKENQWLSDLGQESVSIPFSYVQSNHIRWVHIDEKGEFHVAVPPGRGVILIEARPPMDTWTSGSVPKVPYLTIAGDVTGTRYFRETPKPNELTFPGMQKPIEADDFHTYKLIDPADDSDPLDLRFEVKLPPTQTIRFVDPNGDLITGAKVAGLVPRGQTGEMQVADVLDSDAVAYLDVKNATPRRVIAISLDGKFGAATSITTQSDSPLTIKMQPTASLKLRLIDKTTGKRAFGYRLQLRYGQGVTSIYGLRIDAVEEIMIDKSGEITITSIIPGEPLSLTLIPPQGMTAKSQELESLAMEPGELRLIGNVQVE